MAVLQRLIGSDGYVIMTEIASALVGDGASDLDTLVGGGVGSGAGIYQIDTIASSGSAISALNSAFLTGDYFYNDGTLVPAIGDNVIKLGGYTDSTERDTSIKSFEISLTKDKIDTTTLTDPLKTYRMGRSDASGTMTGVTEPNREILSDRFLDRIEQEPDGTSTTVNRSVTTPLYFVGFLQGQTITSGNRVIAIVGKIEPETFTYGAADGSAQEFTTSFAPTAGDTLQKVVISIP